MEVERTETEDKEKNHRQKEKFWNSKVKKRRKIGCLKARNRNFL